MANILTQEEIDTLLAGISAGDSSILEGISAADDAEAVPYNFMNQDRIVRGGMPTLEVVHDRFARLLQTGMTQLLRRTVEVHVLDNAEQRFGEFARTLPVPSSLHILRLDPLPGNAMLALSGTLIYTLVELFFGGAGSGLRKKDARDFTLVEQRIISNLTTIIARRYAEAWRPVSPLEVKIGASETNPQFVNCAQNSDKVIAVEYEIGIDDVRCPMAFCLPFSVIDPIKETLKGSVISEDGADENTWTRGLRDQLKEARVEMRAMLGSTGITVDDLLKMREGDVIQLDEDFEHPMQILIEDVPKFWGRVGSHKSARSIQITGVQTDERMN